MKKLRPYAKKCMAKEWFSLYRVRLDEPKPVFRLLTQESQSQIAQLKFADHVESP